VGEGGSAGKWLSLSFVVTPRVFTSKSDVEYLLVRNCLIGVSGRLVVSFGASAAGFVEDFSSPTS
jgi:hypothetical protein